MYLIFPIQTQPSNGTWSPLNTWNKLCYSSNIAVTSINLSHLGMKDSQVTYKRISSRKMFQQVDGSTLKESPHSVQSNLLVVRLESGERLFPNFHSAVR